ncbi:hypothetical protein Arash_gp153c [Salmonella phage Arash]|nr:hypothetical protein Arash_gp153c [Salmonella phage Arash]
MNSGKPLVGNPEPSLSLVTKQEVICLNLVTRLLKVQRSSRKGVGAKGEIPLVSEAPGISLR